ncbi:MAG: class I SAM-dependent methyltransferase, partial [Burkholderiales bacterium]
MPQNSIVSVSDERLAEINDLLDWRAGALMPDGRLLGKMYKHKRSQPQPIPDKRINLLNEQFPLKDRKVLEIGCFEGIHSLGLMHHGADVTGIDVRPINVIKTLTRVSMHGKAIKAFVHDASEISSGLGRFDLIFHFGVLYHMNNPVEHLGALAGVADYLYLDTHVAGEKIIKGKYIVDGESYDYDLRGEAGWDDPFSGTAPSSKQLTLESLRRALGRAGYSHVEVLQERASQRLKRKLFRAGR